MEHKFKIIISHVMVARKSPNLSLKEGFSKTLNQKCNIERDTKDKKYI